MSEHRGADDGADTGSRSFARIKTVLSWLQIRFPLWWALTVNLLIVRLSLGFYSVPIGASIRPMDWSIVVLCVSAAGLVAFFGALEQLLWEKPKPAWAWLAIVLSLTPLPLSIFLLRHAMWLRGFRLSD